MAETMVASKSWGRRRLWPVDVCVNGKASLDEQQRGWTAKPSRNDRFRPKDGCALPLGAEFKRSYFGVVICAPLIW
ncbi:MAG: hypothetical protein EON48_00680 [Acetobacteraceae bacterium]|nr:MAG: hypothetical protein EON48_00680 [Acetobacteraceae bacterium]